MRRVIRGKLALGMAVVLLAAALGGCGGKQTDKESISPQTAESAVGASEETPGGETGKEDTQTAAVGLGALEQNAGEPDGSDAAMGRYVEEKIALPEELGFIYDGRVLDDGTVRLLGYINGGNDMAAYDSKDNGDTWEKALSVNEVMGSASSYATCAAIAPDGGLFCQLFVEEDGDYVNRNVKIAADGSWADVELQTEGGMASSIKYKENGRVLVHMSGDNRICLYDDTTGERLRAYNETGGYVNYFGLAGDTVIAMGDGEAMMFDYETGESAAEEALSETLGSDKENFTNGVSNAYPVVFCGGSAAGEMYFCNKQKGICRYNAGDAMVELIADANLNSLAKPSMNLEAIQRLPDDSFLVFARESEAAVFRYTYDADVPATPDTELKVYALHPDDALQQIISDFQTKNPDYYVSLEIGMTGDNAVTASDALRTLNTEMVAGNGPDVLILDGMPVEAYIERGILADISDVVENLKASDGVWETIANTYAKDGAILAVPSRFKVPALVGEPETLAKITDLQSLEETAAELRENDPETRMILEFASIYWGLRVLYRAYSPYLTAEDGSLDTERLREFITRTKELFDLSLFDGLAEEQKAVIYETTPDSDAYGFYDFSTSTPVPEIAMGLCRIGTCNFAGSDTLQTMEAVGERLGVDYAPLKLSEGNVYLPESTVGISSQSSQIDGAKEFVSYLLSRDAQSYNSGSGFPINRAAFEDVLAAPGAYSSSYAMKNEDGSTSELEFTCETLTQEGKDRFRALVEQLDTPALTDAVVEEMVLAQAGECLAGHLSVDDAVNAVNQKMTLYLAE